MITLLQKLGHLKIWRLPRAPHCHPPPTPRWNETQGIGANRRPAMNPAGFQLSSRQVTLAACAIGGSIAAAAGLGVLLVWHSYRLHCRADDDHLEHFETARAEESAPAVRSPHRPRDAHDNDGDTKSSPCFKRALPSAVAVSTYVDSDEGIISLQQVWLRAHHL